MHQDPLLVNTLRPRQNGRHYPDGIFKCIFLNDNLGISISISLKFVPRGSINNIPLLVQIKARRLPGDKPLSEPMMVRLPTHICVLRPHWPRPMSPWTAYTRSVFINIVYDMDTLSALLVVCPSVSNGFQARIVSNTNLWWLRVLLLSWIRFWTNVEGLVRQHHWLCNQKHPWGICSCSPIVNFLKVTFYHGMVTLVIFLLKK